MCASEWFVKCIISKLLNFQGQFINYSLKKLIDVWFAFQKRHNLLISEMSLYYYFNTIFFVILVIFPIPIRFAVQCIHLFNDKRDSGLWPLVAIHDKLKDSYLLVYKLYVANKWNTCYLFNALMSNWCTNLFNRGYSNKATLLLGSSHRYKKYTVVITIWLTVTKYQNLKWQWIFYLSKSQMTMDVWPFM